MDIDVTSVSRREEPLAQTAAAVTVITSEDIRRSGATSIPELLRLVPGLQVARFNAGGWSISARGFNSTAANKLLVLIDGRTVYSPIFSGTFWEVQDMVLDDIARIEVVRGPGAALWGANAVNGIISITTKSADQTKNNAVFLTGGGTDDLAVVSMRNGGAIGLNTSYRVFGKYFYRDQMALANGDDAKDSVRVGRTGFRVDNTRSSDEFTLQGDFYRGFAGILLREDAKLLGGDVLGRWNHRISNTSEVRIQTYYERSLRRVPLQSDIHQRTFDIDLQHDVTVGRHNFTWGAGFRWNDDTTARTPVLFFVPATRSYSLETAFVQDEISLANDRVRLQIGSKFEHNAFSGFEIQPSVRTSWTVHPREFVWAALSRAVRTPTRFDNDIRFGPPGFQFAGNPNFESEDVVAIEFGYRSQPAQQVSLDIATYYNVYNSIRSLEFQPTTGSILLLNNLNANTYGGEITGTYDFRDWLRFNGGYSYLGKRLTLEPGHLDLFNGTVEGNDPKHQLLIRASADLRHGVEWDSGLRFVANLPAPAVPSYFELDQKIGWFPTDTVELSIAGRNLLHRHHAEFGPQSPGREEVRRNVYGRVALRF